MVYDDVIEVIIKSMDSTVKSSGKWWINAKILRKLAYPISSAAETLS